MRTDKTSIIIPALFADHSFVDMTADCLKSLLDYDKPDQIIMVEGDGFSVNVNNGLRAATGDILIISNNDITFTPKWLTGLLEPLHEGYDISSVVTSDQGWLTEDKITGGDRFGSLWAMKRVVYETLGGLDERYATGTFEDADYYLQAKEAGFKIGKNWGTLVEHIGRATFDKVDPKHNNFEQNKIKFKEKWGYVI